MPHFPKPFFRVDRDTWYVQLGGKQINLGTDKKKAFRRYHDLMRDERPAHAPCGKVVELIDEFLDSLKKSTAASDTFEWYRSRLQLFANRYPDLEVEDLKPFHVQRWLDSVEGVKSGTKRNYARSIIRVMWWAEEQGHINKNPLARFRKPKGGRRETVISPEEFERIVDCVPNEAFRDLITFAWETGARAAECLALESRHLDLENGRIVFPQSEEKMERAPRVIYMSPGAIEIVRRRMTKHSGKVFRNTTGQPWNTRSVNCAFNAIQARMGKQAMREKEIELLEDEVAAAAEKLKSAWAAKEKPAKSDQAFREDARRRLWNAHAARHAPKYCLTVIRHSWCHRALKKGLDALTVSQLMGHSDVSMVVEVYSHLSHAPDYLRDAMRRATART